MRLEVLLMDLKADRQSILMSDFIRSLVLIGPLAFGEYFGTILKIQTNRQNCP